jgi:hypothetical protein
MAGKKRPAKLAETGKRCPAGHRMAGAAPGNCIIISDI